MSAADRLFAFRRGDANFRGLSFDTISGAGPNGAIVHYRVTPATDRALKPGDVFLVDSGAQYLDGTTDVTRTVFIDDGTGAPQEVRDRFTRVLKGHIAIATAHFAAGRSMPLHGCPCGMQGWTTTMAPGTASAAISAFTKARSAFRSRAAGFRWSPE